MILDNNFFWILVFVFQVIVLNILAAKFHSYLFYLTGITSGKSLFSAKIAGLFLFIGTLIHELSHIIMAAILFVRVKALNIKTETLEDKHIRFGSAEVELVDPFRNSLIGIAPLIFGLSIIYLIAQSINFINFNWLDIVKLLFISQISNTMFLSKSDTKYFKYVFILFIILISLIYLINSFYQVMNITVITSSILSFINGNNFVEILTNINLVFFYIIIFNFITNYFLQILSKYKRY